MIKRMNSTNLQLALMSIPFLLLVIVFNYVPLFGWAMAFVEYIPGLPIAESKFVGFKYFVQVFTYGTEMYQALINSLVLGLLNFLVSPLPMLVAILLHEVRRMRIRRIVQTAITLPNFISMTIVYAVFFFFFSVDGGLINDMLLRMGIIEEPFNLLGNESATWLFQTLVLIWKTAGWGAIIYLGAINSIDMQLYDAASVDGAGRFRQVLHVTLPGLMPTFLVMMLLGIGNLLNYNFEQIYMFHNSLVHDKIQTIDYYIYQIGLVNFDFSFSTAVGLYKTLVSLALLFMINWIIKKIHGYSII